MVDIHLQPSRSSAMRQSSPRATAASGRLAFTRLRVSIRVRIVHGPAHAAPPDPLPPLPPSPTPASKGGTRHARVSNSAVQLVRSTPEGFGLHNRCDGLVSKQVQRDGS